jgi:hypothetical protein
MKRRAAKGMHVSVEASGVESFDEHWLLLVSLTYLTLGSLAEAVDMVQATPAPRI